MRRREVSPEVWLANAKPPLDEAAPAPAVSLWAEKPPAVQAEAAHAQWGLRVQPSLPG